MGKVWERLALMIILTVAALTAASNGYHVISKIRIGGEGGGDYLTVDSAARRLYVSHSARVVVVDLDTEKVVGEIPDTQGVHGIAIAPKLGRGFTSNGQSKTVTIFDLKTLKSIGQVQTGKDPDAIVYDAVSGRVFAFNAHADDATVIDAKSGKVEGTIPLGGKPETAASDGKGKVYVNVKTRFKDEANERAKTGKRYEFAQIAEIDSRKLTVSKRYTLTGCDGNSGLAMDVAHRRLFSVCENKVMIVSDPDAGSVVATVPIGQGTDGAGFDPGRGLAFSSNGEGTLTVVRETSGKYEVSQNTKTQRGARNMAVDPKTHKIYLHAAQFGPAPTSPKGGSHPPMVPDTFTILVVGE